MKVILTILTIVGIFVLWRDYKTDHMVQLINSPAGKGSKAARLVNYGNGFVMSWLEALNQDQKKGAFALKFSIFEGDKWQQVKTVVESDRMFANLADTPSVVHTEGDRLVAHWLEKTGPETYNYDAKFAVSDDFGSHWKKLGPVRGLREKDSNNYDGFVSYVRANKKVRAFWVDGRLSKGDENNMTLRTALIGNGISDEALLDPSICSCCSTSAVKTTEGAVIFYRGRGDLEFRDIRVVKQTRDGWSAPQSVHNDKWQIAGCPVNGPHADALERTVVVAWFTAPQGRNLVRVAFSNDSAESFGPAYEIDNISPLGPKGKVNVALINKNEAVIIWVGSTEDPKKATLLARRITSDAKVGAIVSLAEIDGTWKSGFPQLLRLDSDHLLVAWNKVDLDDNQQAKIAGIQLAKFNIDFVPKAESDYRPPVSEIIDVENIDLSKIEFTNLRNEPKSLDQLKSDLVLVSFWATWCPSCHTEQEELVDFYAKFASKGLEIVAINLDRKSQRTKVSKFVEDKKIPFQVWLDPQGISKEIFSIVGIPATFLISKSGKIILKQIGFQKISGSDIEKEVSKRLR